ARKAAVDRPAAERGDEATRSLEVVDLDPRATDLRRAVRVASDGAGDVLVLRECLRASIVRGERLAGVEDLDGVDLPEDAVERRAPDVIEPVAAERMRHGDDAALLVDASDRLLRREVARHGLLEEEADDLAVSARDLLAHDHAHAVGDLAEAERALDGVVIGRAHDVDARGHKGRGLRLQGRAAVRRVLAVRVHIDLDALTGHVRHDTASPACGPRRKRARGPRAA